MKSRILGLAVLVLTVAILTVRLAVLPFLEKKNDGDTSSATPPTTAPKTAPPTVKPTTTSFPQTTAPPLSLEDLFPIYQITATVKEAASGLPKGYKGTVRNGKGGVFYRVYAPNGEAVRVEAHNLILTPPPELNLPPVDKSTIEMAVNNWGFESKTDYLVWCNLYRLETYVCKNVNGKWVLLRRMDCSAGDLTHPTPVGVYTAEQKLPAIGKTGEYTCPYAVRFFGHYLFHTLPLCAKDNTPLDSRMGARISNGCIRLRQADALWLYQTLPLGSAVYIR